MDTNKHELVFKEEVYQIVGCAMEVLKGRIIFNTQRLDSLSFFDIRASNLFRDSDFEIRISTAR